MDDYAVGRRRSQVIAAVGLPTKQRFQPSGQIHTGVYQALLNASSPDDLTPALRIKLQAAQHHNTSAIDQWYTETYQRFSLPPPGQEAPSLEGFMLQHGANLEALRDLFAFIPFPELAAKTAPPQQLQLWGRMEAY
ncbi:hypothetical protein ON010_g874 [Phytophthora cinnamomi]|nr:hypothetical protein ON010_g874 [Phytophthora cinnamomi]